MRTLRLTVFCLLVLAAPLISQAAGVGDPLIPFSGTGLRGEKIDLADVVGKKPVMLIFWASWCPNCSREVPKVNGLVKKYGPRGMAFIGINVGYNDSPERARAFMEKHHMAYPVLFDKDQTINRSYRVQGVPTVLIADKSGRIVFRNFGVPEIGEEDFVGLTR